MLFVKIKSSYEKESTPSFMSAVTWDIMWRKSHQVLLRSRSLASPAPDEQRCDILSQNPKAMCGETFRTVFSGSNWKGLFSILCYQSLTRSFLQYCFSSLRSVGSLGLRPCHRKFDQKSIPSFSSPSYSNIYLLHYNEHQTALAFPLWGCPNPSVQLKVLFYWERL